MQQSNALILVLTGKQTKTKHLRWQSLLTKLIIPTEEDFKLRHLEFGQLNAVRSASRSSKPLHTLPPFESSARDGALNNTRHCTPSHNKTVASNKQQPYSASSVSIVILVCSYFQLIRCPP